MKKRIDELVLKQNLASDIKQAQSYIMAGLIYSENQLLDKPGMKIDENTKLYSKLVKEKYVSRGGYKLEKAYQYFNIDVQNQIVLDIGSSTGGFVDCSLQFKAKYVYSVDVTMHLDYSLRANKSVIVYDNTNFRFFKKEQLTVGLPNIVTIDVSFISLNLIFANLQHMLKDDTIIIALIKPQFEAKREQVEFKGVINNADVLIEVISLVESYGNAIALNLIDLTYSPILGKKEGNIEFLAMFSRMKEPRNFNIETTVKNAILNLK